MRVVPHARRLALPFLLALLLPAGLGAQLGAGVGTGGLLEVTTASSSAKAATLAGFNDLNNVFFSRGLEQLRQALAEDPGLGLARVVAAVYTPDISELDRKAEMNRGVADAAAQSPAEELLALAWREWANGSPAHALPLMRAARDLLPNDPGVALSVADLVGLVSGQDEAVRVEREMIAAFPTYAPFHNLLAYQLWNAGDHAGAFAEVRRYIELAPDHPNPYDSHAELLQFGGQYEAAIEQYQAALKAAPGYLEAYTGLAEVSQLQGRGDRARAYLGQAVAGAPSTDARLGSLRAVAGSYLYDGNLAAARNQLAELASQANKAGRSEAESRAHRDLALIDGAFGDGRGVAAHLAVGGEGAAHGELAGIAYALGRQTDSAGAVAAELLASTDSASVRSGHLVQAILAWKGGDMAAARTELAMAPAGAIIRAVTSQVERRSGNSFAANSIRDEVANNRQLNLADIQDIVARRLASGR